MTVKGFFAGALMAIGGLVAVLSGGCSLFFLGILIFEGSDVYVNFGTVAFIGGIPFAVSAVLFLIGRWLRSSKRNEATQDS